MGETIAFLLTLAGTVYFLYWFWKNDNGQGEWGKKRFNPVHKKDEE